jgi:hypothetical protein
MKVVEIGSAFIVKTARGLKEDGFVAEGRGSL